jgi:hypothetical protein
LAPRHDLEDVARAMAGGPAQKPRSRNAASTTSE